MLFLVFLDTTSPYRTVSPPADRTKRRAPGWIQLGEPFIDSSAGAIRLRATSVQSIGGVGSSGFSVIFALRDQSIAHRRCREADEPKTPPAAHPEDDHFADRWRVADRRFGDRRTRSARTNAGSVRLRSGVRSLCTWLCRDGPAMFRSHRLPLLAGPAPPARPPSAALHPPVERVARPARSPRP